MPCRRLAIAVVSATLAVALTACTPEPAATPTPTGFTSEEEAFAAAEETYRAYIDATNQADPSDPKSIEQAYIFTTGEAREDDIESFASLTEQRLRKTGRSQVISMTSVSSHTIGTSWQIEIQICLDVSSIELTRPDGTSAVSPDRPDIQNLTAELTSSSSSSTGMLISAFGSGEGVASCDS